MQTLDRMDIDGVIFANRIVVAIAVFVCECRGDMGDFCRRHPHPVRTLSKPEPPPWLRDRILAEVYAIERRKRRLIAAARCGAVALAMLVGGGGIVFLTRTIAH